jgi:hypothetical protein
VEIVIRRVSCTAQKEHCHKDPPLPLEICSNWRWIEAPFSLHARPFYDSLFAHHEPNKGRGMIERDEGVRIKRRGILGR